MYRNINILVETNEIKRIKMDDGIDRFDAIRNHHNHFICLNCNKIIDIENDYSLKNTYINNNKVIDYEIKYKGICEKCEKEGE